MGSYKRLTVLVIIIITLFVALLITSNTQLNNVSELKKKNAASALTNEDIEKEFLKGFDGYYHNFGEDKNTYHTIGIPSKIFDISITKYNSFIANETELDEILIVINYNNSNINTIKKHLNSLCGDPVETLDEYNRNILMYSNEKYMYVIGYDENSHDINDVISTTFSSEPYISIDITPVITNPTQSN